VSPLHCRLDSRLHRDHASTLILIMTLMDFLYTLK